MSTRKRAARVKRLHRSKVHTYVSNKFLKVFDFCTLGMDLKRLKISRYPVIRQACILIVYPLPGLA